MSTEKMDNKQGTTRMDDEQGTARMDAGIARMKVAAVSPQKASPSFYLFL